MTWFCANCCEEWPEPFCSTCGKMLVDDVNGGSDVPPREPPTRANQEDTRDG